MFHPPQALEHLHHVDVHRAGGNAPPAAHAAWPAVFGHKTALLVIEAKLDAAGARMAKIFAAADQRVAGEEARVPEAGARAGARAQLDVVRHVVAVAGGTDHAATAAGKALLSQFVPDLALILHLEDLGQVADFDLELESVVLVERAALVFGDIAMLDGFEEAAGGEHHIVAEGSADQHLVVVAGIVEEEVEAVVHEIGAHGTAEALFVGDAIDTDDGDILAARLVVRIVVLAGVDAIGDVQLAGVNAVQDVEGVDIAGVHAKQDDALVQPFGGRD